MELILSMHFTTHNLKMSTELLQTLEPNVLRANSFEKGPVQSLKQFDEHTQVPGFLRMRRGPEQ